MLQAGLFELKKESAVMQNQFKDASLDEVNRLMKLTQQAFQVYKKFTLKQRAAFLYTIASEVKSIAEELIAAAQKETHLEESRLKVELDRTLFQLTSYADACAEGVWLDIRIETADVTVTPAKPDLRKMLVPLGPVVVFGASNFPFAYSTAGGDTACALAAGCTVIVKAHPAHAYTSELVAAAVKKAAQKCGLPEAVFIHVHGASFEVGKALVEHPFTKAVGFTGSFEGGKALFDLAAKRKEPIPVFAEMGSVNPVFILPGKLESDAQLVADMLGKSITQSAGQFCTNPGVIVAIENDALDVFKNLLAETICCTAPVPMLHPGIAKQFQQKRSIAIKEGACLIATNENGVTDETSIPTLTTVTAIEFLQNLLLQREIFGPYSLIVACADSNEMQQVATVLEGQLTCTLWATENEAVAEDVLIEILKEKCGRFIFNGVPTGVAVSLAMQHGGPFPATTDSRFTAVGADGIKRFARPVSFQNWSNKLLPDELKDDNPLNIWRTVNNALTKEPIC